MAEETFPPIHEINNYQDIKMQRLRLKIENEFLEEKISDNYELAKYELQPAQLFDTFVQRNFDFSPGEGGDSSNIWQMGYRVIRILLRTFSK